LPNELWSWNIDGAFYSLSFSSSEITFSSGNKNSKIKLSKCNKKYGREFYKKFKSNIEAYSETGTTPKDYSSITVRSPSLGNFDVSRGSKLGLTLIDFKSEIDQLSAQASIPCR